MNTQRFQNAEQYLRAKIEKLPASSKGKVGTGELALRTNDLYIRKEIAIGGKVSLIDANTSQLAGISSFDGNKLNDYVNHIIDKLRFSYTTAATAYAGTPAGLLFATALPAAIKNAQLNVLQNSKVVFSMPISTISNRNTGNTIMDDFRELDNFEMLVSNEPINLEIEFAAGASIPVVVGAERHFVELIVGGFTTFAK